MKLAVVVPRYGGDQGGAAGHARWLAERLALRHEVEVLTTCAGGAPGAEDRYPPGPSTLGGLTVRRFEVTGVWLEEEDPVAPGLLDHLRTRGETYDAFLFFSCRAWTTQHGVPTVPHKSVLVPCAEDEGAPHLHILRLPAAIAFNSPEERDVLAQRAAAVLRGEVVGMGIEDVPVVDPDEIRRRFDLLGDFIVYAGRMGHGHASSRLFEDFTRFVRERAPHLSLVLLGEAALPVPVHVHLAPLGALSDIERRSVIGASRALIQPSESSSGSAHVLEAWTAGRPALVNGRSAALRGLVTRARGGLYYTSSEEMAETLSFLLERPCEADALGRSGRAYCAAHHAAPVIVEKYERLLAAVRGH